MLFIQDQDNKYYLATFGEALIVEPLDDDEGYQVDAKEFSSFEHEVFQFLIANSQEQ